MPAGEEIESGPPLRELSQKNICSLSYFQLIKIYIENLIYYSLHPQKDDLSDKRFYPQKDDQSKQVN